MDEDYWIMIILGCSRPTLSVTREAGAFGNPDAHRGESGRPSTGGTSPLVNVDGSILRLSYTFFFSYPLFRKSVTLTWKKTPYKSIKGVNSYTRAKGPLKEMDILCFFIFFFFFFIFFHWKLRNDHLFRLSGWIIPPLFWAPKTERMRNSTFSGWGNLISVERRRRKRKRTGGIDVQTSDDDDPSSQLEMLFLFITSLPSILPCMSLCCCSCCRVFFGFFSSSFSPASLVKKDKRNEGKILKKKKKRTFPSDVKD